MSALYTAIIVAVIGVQTFWISRAIGRVETGLDDFKAESHRDVQAHTEMIAGLRERVSRLEA